VISDPIIDHPVLVSSNAHVTATQDRHGVKSAGAIGERPLVGPDVDPQSNTLVQRLWWPSRGVLQHLQKAAAAQQLQQQTK